MTHTEIPEDTEKRSSDLSPEMLRGRILGAVGLAVKARGCLIGTNASVDAMREGKGFLLIPASDISDNTKKRLVGTAEYHNIPYLHAPVTKSDLMHAVGKTSDTAAVLFTDRGFVKIIEKLGMEIHTTNTEVLN